MPLLGCGDLNISVSEPFGKIRTSPRVAFNRKLTILDEYDESAANTIRAAGHYWLMTHNPFSRQARMSDRKKVTAPGVLITDELSFSHKDIKLPGQQDAGREKAKNLCLVLLEHHSIAT
jgi:hypothetical protein